MDLSRDSQSKKSDNFTFTPSSGCPEKQRIEEYKIGGKAINKWALPKQAVYNLLFPIGRKTSLFVFRGRERERGEADRNY
jgi:hypothetical protein